MRTADRLVVLDDADPLGEDLDRLDLPDVRRRIRPAKLAAVALTVIGCVSVLFLAFEFGVTRLVESRSQREELRDFKATTQLGIATVPNFVPQPAAPMAILSIPIVGVRQVVVEGTTPDLLKEGPGHVRGTPLPGQVGNVVIAGRRTSYGAPFSRLDELVKGDEIDVTTGQGAFTYVVTGSKIVLPGQPDVLSSSTANVLTIMTSSPAVSVQGRLVVTAALQGPAFPAAARPPVVLEPIESGLSGDPRGAVPAALWFVALLAASILALRLRRRGVNPRILYLFATPIIVTTAFLAFENLDRLLPGTL